MELTSEEKPLAFNKQRGVPKLTGSCIVDVHGYTWMLPRWYGCVHDTLLRPLVSHYSGWRPRTREVSTALLWAAWSIDIMWVCLDRDGRCIRPWLGIHGNWMMGSRVSVVAMMIHIWAGRLLWSHRMATHRCGRPRGWHETMATRNLTHVHWMSAARHAIRTPCQGL